MAEHPDLPIILTTHQMLNPKAQFGKGTAASGPDRQTPAHVWEQLIDPSPQIFLVICGHYHGEAYITKKTKADQPVHLVLQDYQDGPNGGDGWLRIFTFRPEQNKIDVQTYSPSLKEYKKEAGERIQLHCGLQTATARHDCKIKGGLSLRKPAAFKRHNGGSQLTRSCRSYWRYRSMTRPTAFVRPHGILLLAGLLLVASRALPQTPPSISGPSPRLHRIDPQTPQGLQDLLQHTSESLPLVSAHRGGAQPNYPENCIATFENTLKHTFAMMEIDPRYTKDGGIVLNHDATLERTSTGKGLVAERTLAELKQLRLKDSEGRVTEQQITTLDEALEWARGKTILVLDQKDVPVAMRVKKIEEHKAEAYAMVIVFSFNDAKACHRMNPNIMLEVMVPNRQKVADFDKTGVPWRNVVAFVGHIPPEDATLYASIHSKGTSCMVGTSRNFDRQLAGKEATDIKRLEPSYRALLQRGADLIETDLPNQVRHILYGGSPVPASKAKYLRIE